jgi:hypothetical protein
MTQDEGPPGPHEIEVTVPVHVDEPGALATREEDGGATHALESPYGAVDPAGEVLSGLLEEALGIENSITLLQKGTSKV